MTVEELARAMYEAEVDDLGAKPDWSQCASQAKYRSKADAVMARVDPLKRAMETVERMRELGVILGIQPSDHASSRQNFSEPVEALAPPVVVPARTVADEADFAQALFEELRLSGSILTIQQTRRIAEELGCRYNIALKPLTVMDEDDLDGYRTTGGGAAMYRKRVRELLPLTRPLACIDEETTGPDPENDRILELAIVKLHPDGRRTSQSWRINPGCPIPAPATEVHGISDADVVDCPMFASVADYIAEALNGCDLVGYNERRFDLPLLRHEFRRANVEWTFDGSIVDTFLIFKHYERRTLSGAVEFYLGRKHEGAHGAKADADATLDVLLAQMERYALSGDVTELAKVGIDPSAATEDGKIVWNDSGDAVFNFGKEKGRRLVDARSFARWVLGRDFAPDVKALCEKALRGEPVRRP